MFHDLDIAMSLEAYQVPQFDRRELGTERRLNGYRIVGGRRKTDKQHAQPTLAFMGLQRPRKAKGR